MKTLISILLFFTSVIYAQSVNQDVYHALSNSSDKEIGIQIDLLEKLESTAQSRAYLGALFMKQANYQESISKKLNRFKQGRSMLETEIAAFPNNIEYRFLRFIIQENAPSILKYDRNKKEDMDAIYQNYKRLNSDLQKEILSYAQKSKELDISKLNEE